MNKIDYNPLYTLLNDISALSDDLFLSGYSSAGDSTLKKMIKLASDCKNYGLNYPHDMLCRLHSLIEQQRHSGKHCDNEICSALCLIERYTNICTKKLDIDMAVQNLANGGNEE